MNVCLNTYPWAFDTLGGGERQLLNYYSALMRGQHKWPNTRVSLFDMWNPRFAEMDLQHYFGCMPSGRDFLNYAKAIKGIPLVISPNFWPDPEGWAAAGVLDAIKTQLWLADLVIVNSYIEEEALVRLMKIDSSRISVVHNAVDDIFFDPVAPEIFRQKYDIQGPFILNVANIEPRKNQHAFLKALKKFPDLTLVVVGGVRERWYKDACEVEGGHQFRLVEPLESGSEMLRSAMAACEFFAMPSLVETPSIASLEAAAAGARLLTTELGSTKEYFKDFATYVDPFDVDSLVAGVEAVLASATNPDLRREVQNHYTWDKVVEALVTTYSIATGNRFCL
ncbi:glycosyltransferase family 4 protein [Burkholderia ubonensis]|uniref:glycosyltransferase family 4 protein n=1 Tax=Burkholderia ubonensis TaxID=101571 RepID=UPI000758F8E1|nr:glycosyltransferase family 4 protein [Burkholderia ubonensis]KVZ42821.1 hypothetical protein WL17_08635 [Burkholderia ubonensis]